MLHKEPAPFPPPEHYTTLLSKKGRSLQARLVRLQQGMDRSRRRITMGKQKNACQNANGFNVVEGRRMPRLKKKYMEKYAQPRRLRLILLERSRPSKSSI
jgi:hypothetical protein